MSGAGGRREEAARGAGRRGSHRRGGQCRLWGAAGWTAGLRAPASPPLAVPGLAAAAATL